MGGLNPIPYQNDMEYYEKYGHARAPKKETNTDMTIMETY